jgi:mannose-6-phosphate isomerase class I
VQFLFEFIVQEIFGGLGALITRLFGRSPSESGISEMWIGASVVVAVIAIVIAAAG